MVGSIGPHAKVAVAPRTRPAPRPWTWNWNGPWHPQLAHGDGSGPRRSRQGVQTVQASRKRGNHRPRNGKGPDHGRRVRFRQALLCRCTTTLRHGPVRGRHGEHALTRRSSTYRSGVGRDRRVSVVPSSKPGPTRSNAVGRGPVACSGTRSNWTVPMDTVRSCRGWMHVTYGWR